MANKKIPLRKCVACNEMKEKKEMIRVIKTPENEIMLDATGRKNGRDVYKRQLQHQFKRTEQMAAA